LWRVRVTIVQRKRFVCIVEMKVTVNNIEVWTVAQ